jgi:hypothetical protein
VRFRTYWNFELDIPYFEDWIYGDALKHLYDCRMQGLLDGFRHLAIDWMTCSVEVDVGRGRREVQDK